MQMFRLDYLSCFLTVVATVLVGRKMWSGLVLSGINSLIVCVIGVHTSQYGFIPANMFCICIYAFNIRSWLKGKKGLSESSTTASEPESCKRVSPSSNARSRRFIHSFRLRTARTLADSISPLAAKAR